MLQIPLKSQNARCCPLDAEFQPISPPGRAFPGFFYFIGP